MRNYAGKILIRVSSALHEEWAPEAFESGRFNQLCLEAILAAQGSSQIRSVQRHRG